MLLTRVLTAVVVVLALLAAILLLDSFQFRLVVGLVVAVAAWEWSRLSGVRAYWLSAAYAAVCVAVYFDFAGGDIKGILFWIGGIFWILIAPFWLSRGFLPGPQGVLPVVGLVVLVPAGVAMATLSPLTLLFLIGITVVADTVAYFCGRAFGRRKLAPRISPGKTWEGAIGGAVGCLIYATICAMAIPEIRSGVEAHGWVVFLFAVLALSAASVLGDLFESALKRRAGAKDSGNLLPGHGGVLDRIDSATATLPVAALLILTMGIA